MLKAALFIRDLLLRGEFVVLLTESLSMRDRRRAIHRAGHTPPR
jgi:hypothetical protein